MLTHTYIPFTRERFEGVKDTTLNRTKSFARTVRKLKSYYELPSFTVANTWRGASEIIYRFDFPIGFIGITNEIEKPLVTNFVPVLAWKETGSEEFRRYKLWEDVGEILWLPLYNKQKVKAATFYIEIWNTNTTTGGQVLGLEDDESVLGLEELGFVLGLEGSGLFADLTLSEAVRLYTTRLVIPTDLCLEDDIALGQPTTCVDPIFHLEDFEPIFGDYYTLIAPCERLLVKGPKLFPVPNLLQNRDDETWHYVWMDVLDGNVHIYIDPENAPEPPEGTLPYFPLRRIGQIADVYKVELSHGFGGVGNHLVADTIIEDYEEDDPPFVIVLQTVNEQSNNLLYGFYIQMSSIGDLVFNVIQNPIEMEGLPAPTNQWNGWTNPEENNDPWVNPEV